jgi:hypothetical protein
VGSYAIRGGTVCRRHGGSAPQVRAAANRRLAAMALPAVGRLGHFAFDEITRHRLSRGGDRAANNALHRIALVRMSAHPQTRGYVQRQPANGRTNKEILRLFKRAIAREIFRLLARRTRSTNTATCGLPDKPNTSPWPPSPPISASHSSPSRDSNAEPTPDRRKARAMPRATATVVSAPYTADM